MIETPRTSYLHGQIFALELHLAKTRRLLYVCLGVALVEWFAIGWLLIRP